MRSSVASAVDTRSSKRIRPGLAVRDTPTGSRQSHEATKCARSCRSSARQHGLPARCSPGGPGRPSSGTSGGAAMFATSARFVLLRTRCRAHVGNHAVEQARELGDVSARDSRNVPPPSASRSGAPPIAIANLRSGIRRDGDIAQRARHRLLQQRVLVWSARAAYRAARAASAYASVRSQSTSPPGCSGAADAAPPACLRAAGSTRRGPPRARTRRSSRASIRRAGTRGYSVASDADVCARATPADATRTPARAARWRAVENMWMKRGKLWTFCHDAEIFSRSAQDFRPLLHVSAPSVLLSLAPQVTRARMLRRRPSQTP